MRRRFRTKGKFMIVSRIYYLTAASKNEAEMVTPFNVMTEEQLNKAWLMMLSPAGGKSYWPASTQRCTTKLITVQTSVLQIGDKETSGVSCFYTSQIWILTTRWICVVSQLSPLHLCPPDLSCFLSIRTPGWPERTRHDRVECPSRAFSQEKTDQSFYTTLLFLFLQNRRQNISSQQMFCFYSPFKSPGLL